MIKTAVLALLQALFWLLGPPVPRLALLHPIRTPECWKVHTPGDCSHGRYLFQPGPARPWLQNITLPLARIERVRLQTGATQRLQVRKCQRRDRASLPRSSELAARRESTLPSAWVSVARRSSWERCWECTSCGLRMEKGTNKWPLGQPKGRALGPWHLYGIPLALIQGGPCCL